MMPVRAATKKQLDWLFAHHSLDRVCHTLSSRLPGTRNHNPLIRPVQPIHEFEHTAQKLQYKPPPDFVQPEFSCDAVLAVG